MAERELSAFLQAVSELHGPQQAEASADDWLHQLAVNKFVPTSAREWRALTIAAAARLASRVTRSYEEEPPATSLTVSSIGYWAAYNWSARRKNESETG